MNRKQYKSIKKYDRQEMDTFIEKIYKNGFKDGSESGVKADFKIRLLQVLNETPRVGEKTINNILDTLKEMER